MYYDFNMTKEARMDLLRTFSPTNIAAISTIIGSGTGALSTTATTEAIRQEMERQSGKGIVERPYITTENEQVIENNQWARREMVKHQQAIKRVSDTHTNRAFFNPTTAYVPDKSAVAARIAREVMSRGRA